MIYKELDPFQGRDKFEVAGRKAEEQMAFYLRRFFAKSDDVDVLNYLRIELGGEVAQMDHLVLHPYGLLIVESKSVSGSVQIKDDGQWIRWFGKQPSGMRSPITQAKMQASLPDKACKHCRSSDLEVRYGQYGYYFYCRSCQKNTAIRFACPACGSEGRIRKAGKEFFAECKACDASAQYHSN